MKEGDKNKPAENSAGLPRWRLRGSVGNDLKYNSNIAYAINKIYHIFSGVLKVNSNIVDRFTGRLHKKEKA